MPKRGLAALAITTVALILLISFKVPDESSLDRTTGNLAIVEPSTAPVTPAGPAVPGAAATPAPAATKTPAATSGDGPARAQAAAQPRRRSTARRVDTGSDRSRSRSSSSGGKVADVVALQLPTGRRSGQISTYAAPILHEEALQAQSANIDTVSGATYTSDAYAQSLQAALDQAGLG